MFYTIILILYIFFLIFKHASTVTSSHDKSSSAIAKSSTTISVSTAPFASNKSSTSSLSVTQIFHWRIVVNGDWLIHCFSVDHHQFIRVTTFPSPVMERCHIGSLGQLQVQQFFSPPMVRHHRLVVKPSPMLIPMAVTSY